MAVDSVHPLYKTHNSTMTTDAYNGNVNDYVPRLTSQTDSEFNNYVSRGSYYNATKRTVEALTGAVMRKPPVYNLEGVHGDEHITLCELAGNVVRAQFLDGRAGLLVDFNEEMQEPYIVSFKTEQIINWRKDKSLIVIMETVEAEDPDDPYELKLTPQIRELFLDQDGFYVVQLWRMRGGTERGQATWERFGDPVMPTSRGERIPFIPFTFVTPFDTTDTLCDPVATNLAQINISHFLNSVDYEHGIHKTALPTPVLSGNFIDDVGTQVALGTDFVWRLEEGASVKYLEFTGAGLEKIREAMDQKERQMAAIGADLLTPKNGVESAEALRIRAGAQSATLMSIVEAVESALRQCLQWVQYWRGSDEEVVFLMNRDFAAAPMDPQQVKALSELYIAGQISMHTFLDNLHAGEIIPSTAEELERLGLNLSDMEDE